MNGHKKDSMKDLLSGGSDDPFKEERNNKIVVNSQSPKNR
jgi:hypothetical protein